MIFWRLDGKILMFHLNVHTSQRKTIVKNTNSVHKQVYFNFIFVTEIIFVHVAKIIFRMKIISCNDE